jgi:photosystem II stability/assembly factor-like uncharacterized protein
MIQKTQIFIAMLFILAAKMLAGDDFEHLGFQCSAYRAEIVVLGDETYCLIDNGLYRYNVESDQWAVVYSSFVFRHDIDLFDYIHLELHKDKIFISRIDNRKNIPISVLSNDKGENFHHLTVPGAIYGSIAYLFNDTIIAKDVNYRQIYRSTNNGQEWDEVDIDHLGVKYLLSKFFAFNNGLLLLVGSKDEIVYLLITNDFGLTWERYVWSDSVNQMGYPNGIKYRNGRYYMFTWSGIYVSDDISKNWKSIGLTGTFIFEMEVLDNGDLLAATEDGLFLSSDKGNSWNIIDVLGDEFENVKLKWVMQIDKDSEENLFCFVNGYGVFKSTDGGFTWKSSSKGLNYGDLKGLGIAKNGRLFAGNYGLSMYNPDTKEWSYVKNFEDMRVTYVKNDENYNLYVATHDRHSDDITTELWKSTDNGETWDTLWDKQSYSPIEYIFPNWNGDLYVQTKGAGYFYSKDKGETWEYFSKCAPNSFGLDYNNNIYSSWYGGLLKRNISDNHWDTVLTLDQNTEDFMTFLDYQYERKHFIFNPASKLSFAYIDVINHTIWSSESGNRWWYYGRYWYEELDEDRFYRSGPIAVDSSYSFLAADHYNNTETKIKRTNSTIDYFHYEYDLLSGGLDSCLVKSFHVSPDGYIYIVSNSNGIYKSKSTYVDVEELPTTDEEIATSPNPAEDFLEIKLPGSYLNYGLEVYDAMGARIDGISMENRKVDVSKLPPGIYLLRVVTSDEIFTGKFIKR